MNAARDWSVCSIEAPSGYGKTTVLAQWAGSSADSIAWLTVEGSDNDPALLFSNIAAAIGRLIPVGKDVRDGIHAPGPPIRAIVGRLLAAMDVAHRPLVLVIDDAHLLTQKDALDPLAEFISHLPRGSRVVICGRTTLDLPTHRWRALGKILELGPQDLAMDEVEGAELVRRHAPGVADTTVRGLIRRTEGWPALLTLASMSASRLPDQGVDDPRCVEWQIADFLRHEILEREVDDVQDFLLKTSILDHLNGSVCDALGVGPDSGATLRGLAHSLVLVDEYGGWYRYHPLLREFLEGELQARQPGIVPELHQRAAAWFEAHGAQQEAVEHAFAGNDLDRAAALIAPLSFEYHWSARRGTLRTWMGRFSDEELERRPWLALLAAFVQLSSGEAERGERLFEIADLGRAAGGPTDVGGSFDSFRAALRSAMGLGGVDAMLANARLAAKREPRTSPWRAYILWVLGAALITADDTPTADETLVEAIAAAGAHGATGLQHCIAGHRALLALDRGDWELAGALMSAHPEPARGALHGYPSSAAACAARARLAIRRGDVAEARRLPLESVAVRPKLAPFGGLGVQCLIGLARAHLALDDPAGARASIAHATDIIHRRPGLGVLPAQVEAIETQLASLPIGVDGASTLTPAELRVLALLPYYLSFAEIGERLGVQATTVKSHALAIYGKLGASSRAEAVELAVAVGLLERFPA